MSKVLVIGDSCTDIFIYGEIERISPEAPVPVIKPMYKTENGGMAKNIEANLKVMGCEVDLITNLNNIVKKRYVDDKSNQMVLRVDENDSCERIDENELIGLDGYDAIIISDYCKGFLEEEDIQYICENNQNVFVDTKKELGDWINLVDYVKINSLEYKKNEKFFKNNDIINKTIVTQGNKGCLFRGEIYSTEDVPVKDISGAGDTFLAGLTVEYVRTNDIIKAINFAQECTKIVIQKHGVSTV